MSRLRVIDLDEIEALVEQVPVEGAGFNDWTTEQINVGELRALLDRATPQVPDGYALVPIEPTEDMIKESMVCHLKYGDVTLGVLSKNIYKAMITEAMKG